MSGDDAGVVLPDDVRPEAWRNGHGLTRVLARGDGWRISLAEIVADAPFSAFPGVDRILTVLGEEPLTLVVDGERRALDPGSHTAFPGEAEVRATAVSAPVRVLNAMTDRGSAHCEVRAPGTDVGGGAPTATTLLAVLTGTARLDGVTLPPGALVRRPGLFPRVERGSALLAHIHLTHPAPAGRHPWS